MPLNMIASIQGNSILLWNLKILKVCLVVDSLTEAADMKKRQLRVWSQVSMLLLRSQERTLLYWIAPRLILACWSMILWPKIIWNLIGWWHPEQSTAFCFDRIMLTSDCVRLVIKSVLFLRKSIKKRCRRKEW